MTRLFSVEDIGFYTLFISFAAIFTAVLNLRYDMAIVSCREGEVFPLIKGCIFIGVLLSVIATTIYYIYLIMQGILAVRMWTIPCFGILCIANSLSNILTSYNNRNQEYKIISSVYVIRNVIQNIAPLLLAFFSNDVLWLVIPYVIGQLFGLRRQSMSLRGKWRAILKTQRSDVLKPFISNRGYALYSTPAMLANSISYSSVTIALEALFSTTVVGYYSLTTRILGLPISLVGGNIAKVVFQESSDEYSKTGRFQDAFIRAAKLLILVAVVSFILIIFLAKPACTLFFGPTWEKAGEYIQLLAPMFSFQLVCTALSPGLLVSHKQSIELVFQVALALTTFIAIGAYQIIGGSELVFLLAVGFLKSIVYIAMILTVWKCSKGV